MTLLFGGIGVALSFAGELYDYRDMLCRVVPKVMQLRYHGSDLYWDDLLEYMQYLNEAITGDTPLVVYDEEKGHFVNDYRFTREADETTVTETVDYSFTVNGEPAETIAADTEPPFKLFEIDTNKTEPPVTEAEAETAVPDVTTVAVELTEPITDVTYTSYIGECLINDVRADNLSYSVTRSDTTISDGSGYDYGYGLAWVGGELYVIGADSECSTTFAIPGTNLFGRPYQDVETLREYLRDITANGYARDIFTELDPTVTIILQPNSRIVDSYGGLLSAGQRQTYALAALCWGIVALIVLIIALFAGVIIDIRSKAAADAAIGRLIGRIWIELRWAILLIAVWFYVCLIDYDEAVGYIFLIATFWFWLYCIGADLRQNGLRTFTCNIITSTVNLARRRTARLPLHKAMARRIRVYGIPAALCVIAAFFCFGFASGTYGFSAVFLIVLGIYGCVGALVFILLFFRSRSQDYADIAALMNRICEIREGRAGTPFSLPESHRFAPYAVALESIYAGIETAVAERTKSERTKIEMVTNISHDLKTPLTSIVGYADLLAGIEGLPPEAADYVAVITKKSVRLNALIKDLFELSKATTNDLPLRPEPLDLVRLLNQLLAEQADAIAAAPVTLVTTLPDHECPCFNDGTKLYRVFANLLENALRYALDGSRVFLSLSSAALADGTPVWRVTVKNTSREYIDFTADEILARFVRGDRNRTTDGNGLGLPIAKSFTELCGGRFDLTLDGDIFCVTVDLPQSARTE